MSEIEVVSPATPKASRPHGVSYLSAACTRARKGHCLLLEAANTCQRHVAPQCVRAALQDTAIACVYHAWAQPHQVGPRLLAEQLDLQCVDLQQLGALFGVVCAILLKAGPAANSGSIFHEIFLLMNLFRLKSGNTERVNQQPTCSQGIVGRCMSIGEQHGVAAGLNPCLEAASQRQALPARLSH